jgi:hypothetical protein
MMRGGVIRDNDGYSSSLFLLQVGKEIGKCSFVVLVLHHGEIDV